MAKKKAEKKTMGFPLDKENYRLMAIGVVLIVIGFILMAGGAPESPDKYNPGVFSFRRITLAPIIVLLGYALEAYAIMKKPKDKNKEVE
jgi:hypothetical protein